MSRQWNKSQQSYAFSLSSNKIPHAFMLQVRIQLTYHRLFSLMHHTGIPMLSDKAKIKISISYLFGASCLGYVLFIVFHCWTRLHRCFICCSTFSDTSCIPCPPRDWLESRTCRKLICVIEMLYGSRLYTMKVKVGVTGLQKYMWAIQSRQCTCMTIIPCMHTLYVFAGTFFCYFGKITTSLVPHKKVLHHATVCHHYRSRTHRQSVHAPYCIPCSGKLSREKTFTNFAIFQPSAKVFSIKF